MSEISCIGLGLMGAALARCMLRAGHRVTVWNRSPARLAAFADAGVARAADMEAAVRASPVVLICIDNYRVTQAMLGPVAAALRGRVVVQLSTGTPKEAEALGAWVRGQGAEYLDGAILCGPEQIGAPDAEILLCGDAGAEAQAMTPLAALGGAVRHLGPNLRAAAALDLAWLTPWYAKFLALAHAAKICAAEGVAIEELMALYPDDAFACYLLAVLRDQSFGDYTASLAVWGASLARVQEQARDAGISTDIPDFLAGYFKKAVAAGFGQQNVMALSKVV